MISCPLCDFANIEGVDICEQCGQPLDETHLPDPKTAVERGLITDPVSNWMHLDKSCRLDIAVGVDYGTDVELLRSTLLGVAKAHRSVLKKPPAVVHFAGFGDSSLDFELRVFLRDMRERITCASELRFAILAALQEAGISIPFPQRDIHIKDAPADGGVLG